MLKFKLLTGINLDSCPSYLLWREILTLHVSFGNIVCDTRESMLNFWSVKGLNHVLWVAKEWLSLRNHKPTDCENSPSHCSMFPGEKVQSIYWWIKITLCTWKPIYFLYLFGEQCIKIQKRKNNLLAYYGRDTLRRSMREG